MILIKINYLYNMDYDDDYEEDDPFYGYEEEEWYEIEEKINYIKVTLDNKYKFEKILFTLEKQNMSTEKALDFLLNDLEKKNKKNEKKKIPKEDNKKKDIKKEVKIDEMQIKRKYSKHDSYNDEYILEEKFNNNKIEKSEINEKVKRKNSKKIKEEIKTNYNEIYPNVNKIENIKNLVKINNINIVICGHVDAGKSTLLGQIFYLLKLVDKHSLDKLEKEASKLGKKSFKFAWILDEREDEREKGITIEVNDKTIEFKGKKFTFLDTPGHRDFVPQMIKGACQADYALLIVEACKTGFLNGFNKGGQTSEHANIINSMGVKNMIIVVNKMDLEDWKKENFDYIKNTMLDFFEKNNFTHFERFIFVPISAFNGENIITKKKLSWYNGDCLFDILDKFQIEINDDVIKPLRGQITSIDEYSLGNKKGTALTCKLYGGVIKPKDTILISPRNLNLKVESIFIENEKMENAICGNICEIIINKKENIKDEIKVGNIISSIEYPIPIVKNFIAKVFLGDLKNPIVKGNRFLFFFGSNKETGIIKKILTLFDNQNGKIIKKNPRIVDSKDNILVEIQMDNSVSIECFKNYKFFSRFQIREEFKVIGFGFIEEIIN